MWQIKKLGDVYHAAIYNEKVSSLKITFLASFEVILGHCRSFQVSLAFKTPRKRFVACGTGFYVFFGVFSLHLALRCVCDRRRCDDCVLVDEVAENGFQKNKYRVVFLKCRF